MQLNQAQAILFDLGALKNLPNITHKCDVLFDGEGKGYAGFIMVGKNSEQYREVQRQLRLEGLQRSAARKEAVDTSTPEGAAVVIDAIDDQNMRTACAVVTGWYGLGQGGQAATFDASVLPELFKAMPTWKDKVLADLEKEGNFMPR